MAAVTFARALSTFDLPCCLGSYLREVSLDSSNALVCHLQAAMRAASMATFARELCGCADERAGRELQIGLYVQGLCCHTSHTRR